MFLIIEGQSESEVAPFLGLVNVVNKAIRKNIYCLGVLIHFWICYC